MIMNVYNVLQENIAKFGKQAGCIEFEPDMTWFNTSQTITRYIAILADISINN